MKTMMKFFGDVSTPVAVATVDGNSPRVRFFSFKMVEDGELYFITSKKKAVYRELLANPNIEICSMPSESGQWVRLQAQVELVQDISLNKKAFQLLPLLEKAYGVPENEDIVLLKMIDKTAALFGMTGLIEELNV